MTRKIISFAVTLGFLIGAVWFINNNPEFLFKNTKMKDRTIKSLSYESQPEMKIDATKKYTAEVETSEGKMKFELFNKEAPLTVNNFVFLSREGFYENTFFHRIVKGFMIQGGDPKGDGTGGPGYAFSDEPVTRDYEKGIIAMANAGPNTNGSQFFVMHSKLDLPKNYTIFGKLTEGEDVLDKIAETPTVDNGYGEISKPTKRVYIEKINITEE